MDEWESIFTRRLDALGAAPDDLFDNEEEESPMFGVGPALMKHKFILEPENSPFKYVTMCVCIATWGKLNGGGGMRVGAGDTCVLEFSVCVCVYTHTLLTALLSPY